MLIILIMAVGVLIGLARFPQRFARYNSRFQIGCTMFLIFCMGIDLGRRKNFFDELASVGWQSFVLVAIPILLSVLLVFILTKLFFQEKQR